MTVIEILSQLEVIRDLKKPLEAEVKRLETLELGLRTGLTEQMKKEEIVSQKSDSGKIMAINTTRKDYKVVDESTVKTFLQSNGMLEECIRLDLMKVKEIARKQEVPGVEIVELSLLAIREIKDKVEAIKPEVSAREAFSKIRNDR